MEEEPVKTIYLRMDAQGTEVMCGVKYLLSCLSGNGLPFMCQREEGSWSGLVDRVKERLGTLILEQGFPKGFRAECFQTGYGAARFEYPEPELLHFLTEREIPEDCRARG